MKFLIVLLWSNILSAAILGDVAEVSNSPGYIDVSAATPFYQGVSTSPIHSQGADKRTPSQILMSFTDGARIDVLKIQDFIHRLIDTQNNIKVAICIDEFRKKIKSYQECRNPERVKNFAKEWKGNKFRIALDVAIQHLEDAKHLAPQIELSHINKRESQKFLEHIFTSHEIFEGIRAEDEQRGSRSSTMKLFYQARDILFGKDIVRMNRVEAANLLKPNTDYNEELFFSYEQLVAMKARGEDLSVFDPPSTGFWRKPKQSISSFDTVHYDHQGQQQLDQLMPLSLADDFSHPAKEVSVVYTGSKIGGGTTPKFNVYIGKYKWKLKFLTNKHEYPSSLNLFTEIYKHVQGSEVNTEPVVNNLAAALGFTVDPTYYKEKVRVYFDQQFNSYQEFYEEVQKLKNEISEEFASYHNTDSAFEVLKQDENGRYYIEMKSVSLESKSNNETDFNIGFFTRDGLGKTLMREHRGFYTFLAWIGDPDVKNDNDKVKLVPYYKNDGTLSYKVMLSNSDMGGALGFGMPNLYNTHFINGVGPQGLGGPESLSYQYLRIFPFPLSKAVSINDAKWMARRIAQLSLAQIKRAYYHAGYPEVVSHYYALLMLKKRNQLIEALGMMGEEFIDDGGKPFTIEKAPEFTGTIEGFEEYFENGHLIDPQQNLYDDQRENWNRNWGFSWRNSGVEDAQANILKAVKISLFDSLFKFTKNRFLDSLVINQNGLTHIPVRPTSDGGGCESNCFIQGVGFGLSHFVPMRYIVANPAKNSKKPYWVVDIFRVGVVVGANTHLLSESLGFDIPQMSQLKGGLRFHKLIEYIKVHPTANPQDYLKNRKNILRLSKSAISGHRKQLVDSLASGDSLIISQYLGAQAGVRYSPDIVIPFLSAQMGLGNVSLSRLSLLKGKEGALYANWGKGHNKRFDARFGIRASLIKLPFVQYTYDQLTRHDHSYIFDLTSHEQRSYLMNNLGTSFPKDIPLEYLAKERLQKETQHRTLLSFLNIFGKQKYKKTFYNEFNNFEEDISFKNKIYEIETEKFKKVDLAQMVRTTSRQVSVDSEGELLLGYDLLVTHPMMKRSYFKYLVQKYQYILPEDLFVYDLNGIKHFMGRVRFNVSIWFNLKGLKHFLDSEMTEVKLCRDYAEFRNQDDPIVNCGFTENKPYRVMKYFRKDFEKLWDKFRSARYTLESMADKSVDEIYYGDLKALVKFLKDSDERVQLLEYMISKVRKKHFKRDVEISSSLAAFPGDIEVIKESKLRRGKLKINKSKKMHLATDHLHEALGALFFNAYILRKI